MIKAIFSIIIVVFTLLANIGVLYTTATVQGKEAKPVLISYAELAKEYVLNCNLDTASFFVSTSCHVTLTKLHDNDCQSSLSAITIEVCNKIDQYLKDNPK